VAGHLAGADVDRVVDAALAVGVEVAAQPLQVVQGGPAVEAHGQERGCGVTTPAAGDEAELVDRVLDPQAGLVLHRGGPAQDARDGGDRHPARRATS
jgi:hypothetical protein